MASKKQQESRDAGPNKRPRVGSPPSALRKTAVNPLDCNLDMTVESDGITASALYREGFAYCWSGARSSFGVTGGKYCFGCRVIENQPVIMEDTAKDLQNLCRVGISRGDSDVGSLGESSTSFGYGGTGKFSHGGVFTSYGGVFGVGDTIICAVDLEDPSRAKVSFAKNGKWLGVALEFDAGPRGLDITGALDHNKALFPHILLKNVKVRMMLSVDHGLRPLEGFKPWDAALSDGNAGEGPQAATGRDCEVIMMVGLPGSGKTTWAQKWIREHPEKHYVLLGTNLALDQMKVPGLLRKRNYGERFERLMDRATKIFNQLMDRASKTSRNFIIDQTNVYRNARIRKLKPFRNFRKIAVVIFPHPEELRRRTHARAQEMGKEVPEDAVREMLANFVLPNSKEMLNSVEPFDEVRFIELQRGDAERYLADMKSAFAVKNPGNTSSSSQTHESPCYQGPYGPSPGCFQSRQTTFSNHYPREGLVSCYGGRQESFLAGDHYAQETTFNVDRSFHARESSNISCYGFPSSPFQGSYGPSSRVDNPAQILHSTSSVGGYPGFFAGNSASRYGDSHLPSSRAGQSMPSSPSYRRF